MRKVFKGIWAFLLKFFKNNWGWKTAAVLFSVLLWSFAWVDQNPWRTKTLSDVSVNRLNEYVLRERGLMVVEESENFGYGVNVHTEVRQQDYASLTANRVTASIDMGTITTEGTHNILVAVEPALASTTSVIKSVNPSRFEVTIESILERRIPIRYKTEGRLPSNYYHKEPVFSVDQITIKGAKSYIERASYGECVIQLHGLTESIDQSLSVTLFDQDGNELEPPNRYNLIGEMPSVIANMEVLYQKEVVVDAAGNITGMDSIEPGYSIKDIHVQPAKVTLVGSKAMLETIESIQCEPLSVSGAQETVIEKMELVLPEGVESLNGKSVRVHVEIEKNMMERTFENVSVVVRGTVQSGTIRAEHHTATATIKGWNRDIQRFYEPSLELYVDVNGLNRGTHKLNIQNRYTGEIIPDEIVIDPKTITIVIE
ncbi:MAG: YbbR-like domain-containing protein [Christensenellales bacterium]|jgi:YbbR domain-containing protein